MKRAYLALVTIQLAWLACPALAETYSCALTNGQSGKWSAAATWKNGAGAPGVPTKLDTIIVNALPTGTFNLDLDAGWGAKALTLNSTGTAMHYLSLQSDGFVETLTFNTAAVPWVNGLFWQQFDKKVTLQQYSITGPNIPSVNWGGGYGSALLFTNAAQITYHTTNITELSCQANFSGAASVHLARSTALTTTTVETIANLAGNTLPFAIGRCDNGKQTWTVAAGSHPLLCAVDGSQSMGFSKVGTGDVMMPDVDLAVIPNVGHSTAISASGFASCYGEALYGGTLYANSLQYSRAGSVNVTTARFDVVGNLVLGGQAGRQAGGAGNGRAFSLVSPTNGLTRFKIGSQSTYIWHNIPLGNAAALAGHLTITPAGGDFYLYAPPSGAVRLELYSGPSNRANATITANTIHLASPSVTIDDRDPNNTNDVYAGGTIEFRGDFVSQCTDNNNFRLDHSTLRVIGGGTKAMQSWECMSSTNQPTEPGTNNFVIGELALGQTSTGSVNKVELVLRDQNDNNTGDAGRPEALYVGSLTMYAGSVLYLNGRTLYCKNSGLWLRPPLGSYTAGDGSGRILDTPPPGFTSNR